MRNSQKRAEATNQRALIRSWTVTRGFIGGALLVVGALAFTLLVAAFLQYLTIARNDRVAHEQPFSEMPENRSSR
jgi:hypothetical protein